MWYLLLKYIHVLSSTILFGTGIGTACIMVYGHKTKNPQVIAAVTQYAVLADWIFTGSSGFIQPVTGFALVYIAGYSWTSGWVLGSIIGYLIAAFCWFPVVYLQIKLRDFALAAQKNKTALPAIYFRYYKYWYCLGWPAFLSLIVVFYLMTNKPS
jgi:uncharacterized membrane protein